MIKAPFSGDQVHHPQFLKIHIFIYYFAEVGNLAIAYAKKGLKNRFLTMIRA